jgi:hypothetical protein
MLGDLWSDVEIINLFYHLIHISNELAKIEIYFDSFNPNDVILIRD